jgi:hypothetical protein
MGTGMKMELRGREGGKREGLTDRAGVRDPDPTSVRSAMFDPVQSTIQALFQIWHCLVQLPTVRRDQRYYTTHFVR